VATELLSDADGRATGTDGPRRSGEGERVAWADVNWACGSAVPVGVEGRLRCWGTALCCSGTGRGSDAVIKGDKVVCRESATGVIQFTVRAVGIVVSFDRRPTVCAVIGARPPEALWMTGAVLASARWACGNPARGGTRGRSEAADEETRERAVKVATPQADEDVARSGGGGAGIGETASWWSWWALDEASDAVRPLVFEAAICGTASNVMRLGEGDPWLEDDGEDIACAVGVVGSDELGVPFVS